MELRVRQVKGEEPEVLEIRYHKMTDGLSEIISFVKSRAGQISADKEGRSVELPVIDIFYAESVDNRLFIYTAIGALPNLLSGSYKELSVKGLLIRRFFELIFIEAAVLVIAFSVNSIPTERTSVVAGLAVGIAVVYILTIVVEYIIELGNSKKLNEALYRYQKTDQNF